jgi:hypothetical protein
VENVEADVWVVLLHLGAFLDTSMDLPELNSALRMHAGTPIMDKQSMTVGG